MPDSNYSLADLSAVMGKDGMFGGNGASWIVMLLIFFLFFRNGGNGFGGDFGTVATQAATQDSVRNVLSNIESSKILDAIQGNSAAISQLAQSTGISFESMNAALCNVRTTIIETANATNLSIKDLGTQIAMNNGSVLAALQNSCSQLATQMLNGFNAQNIQMLTGFANVDKTLCDIRYNAEKNATAIIQAGNANTDKILQAFATDRFNTLQTDLALARSQISQFEQTQNIVNQLKNSCGCGCNSGCGCNC